MENQVDIDLENWMGCLDNKLREIPIIHLAIPGSHDAMTYPLTKKSKIAPDADEVVEKLHKLFPNTVVKWTKTQDYDILQQLEKGVRYFDLRLCLNKEDAKYYFVHGLYCDEITESLKILNEFLNQHQKEVVILDFQHFYEFDDIGHDNLAQILIDIFGDKFYRRIDVDSIADCTLVNSFEKKKQIIAIYRSNQNMTFNYWFSQDWPTPWPNVVKVKKLEEYLEENLSLRNPNAGYVSQCVLTPDTKFIMSNLKSSIKSACAMKVLNCLSPWIQKQEPGSFQIGEKGKVNVLLADFVDINNTNFCKMVIDLNAKILK